MIVQTIRVPAGDLEQVTDFMERSFCGYLAANLRVAAKLTLAAAKERYEEVADAAWAMLRERAEAVWCRLCPTLTDRDENPVGDLVSDEPSQDLAMFAALITQLEANDGRRP